MYNFSRFNRIAEKGRFTVSTLVGIHALLAHTPIWLTAFVLWVFTDGAIHLLRDKLEGLAYQTAFSAKFGDAGLIGAILIGATILQRDGVYIPMWLQSGWLQVGILVACFSLGVLISLWTKGMRSGQVGDVYHDVVIVPIILFFAITVGPVVWYNARWYELLFVAVAVVVWVTLAYFDVKYERVNQRQWLVRHGFAIKGEIPRR